MLDTQFPAPTAASPLAGSPPLGPDGDALPAAGGGGEAILSIIEAEDGSITFEFGDLGQQEAEKKRPSKFDNNLAEDCGEIACSALANTLLEGIEADIASRRDRLANYNKGLELLATKINEPSSQGPTISTVRHPGLLKAIIDFQSRSRGEMLPASGPVKVRNDGRKDEERDQRASDLQKDLNHWLTTTATEFYPDTDRGLFYLGYGGTLYKKAYRCPRRGRPVSECVYLPDLIVAQDATDLDNASRVTHVIPIDQGEMTEMQLSGQYLDISLGQPNFEPTSTQTAEAQLTGIAAKPTRPEDQPFTVYECYVRLDLALHNYYDPEAPDDGRRVPYRVSIEKTSRRVLEIRRCWKQGDELYRKRKVFIKYGMIPGMGFLDWGLLDLVGNNTKAATAVWRMLLDSGMFANFPGGLFAKGARITDNELRPNPGQFKEIDTGGADIRASIMALPYKEPSAVLLELLGTIESQIESAAGTINVETGDSGIRDVPVGTILAQIEQQAVIMTAVHKRGHQSQQEEFMALKELFVEDPEAITRGNPDPARKFWTAEELADLTLVPASDPNVPAHTQRIMNAYALEMLASAHPDIYNQRAVQPRLLRTLNVENPEELLLPEPEPADPAQDPMTKLLQMQAQIEQMKTQVAAFKAQADAKGKAADIALRAKEKGAELATAEAERRSKEAIATQNNETKLIIAGLAALNQPAQPDPMYDEQFGP